MVVMFARTELLWMISGQRPSHTPTRQTRHVRRSGFNREIRSMTPTFKSEQPMHVPTTVLHLHRVADALIGRLHSRDGVRWEVILATRVGWTPPSCRGCPAPPTPQARSREPSTCPVTNRSSCLAPSCLPGRVRARCRKCDESCGQRGD